MPQGGNLTTQTVNAELDADYAERRNPIPAGRYVMLAVSDI